MFMLHHAITSHHVVVVLHCFIKLCFYCVDFAFYYHIVLFFAFELFYHIVTFLVLHYVIVLCYAMFTLTCAYVSSHFCY